MLKKLRSLPLWLICFTTISADLLHVDVSKGKRAPISEIITLIHENQNAIVTKFGDGEMLCMMGINGKNCDGDTYHEWLCHNLSKSLINLLYTPHTFLGAWSSLQKNSSALDNFLETFIKKNTDPQKIKAQFVYYNLISNDDFFNEDQQLYEFVHCLQKTPRKKILICNEKNKRLQAFFHASELILIPYQNWSLFYKFYKQKLIELLEPKAVVIIAGGLCSKVLISEISQEFEVSFFDIGSGFDFLGSKRQSRDHKHSLYDELHYYGPILPDDWKNKKLTYTPL